MKINSLPEWVLNGLFILFLLILFIMRALIFFNVNILYIDSDQPFMWAGVKDYAEGHFYEPRYYGQDYNTFMEALFAVPLYWLSVPVYYALPIATHFISLFPFLFPAFYLFFHGKKENALLILAILLCLPTGYDIMNGIPRGFVPGLFFTSFFILSAFHPTNNKYTFLNTVMAVAGYFVNPNSVLVSVPFLFFLFLKNYKSKRYYYTSGIALLSILPLHLLFNQFYISHPSYVVLALEYNMTPDYFWHVLTHLNDHFAHISFFVEENALPLLLVVLGFIIALYRQNKVAFYTCLCFLGMILFSFFSDKTVHGVNWPFYSYSRMFLGIPVFLAFISAFFFLRSGRVIITLIVIALGFSIYKFVGFKRSVYYHTEEKSRWTGVHLASLSQVLQIIDFYKGACDTHHCDRIIISNTFWGCTYMNYGGPAIVKDFPATEETNSERRYMVREGNKDKVFDHFILLSVNYDLDKQVQGKYNFDIRRLDDYGLFLIEHNRLKNKDFISLVKSLE